MAKTSVAKKEETALAVAGEFMPVVKSSAQLTESLDVFRENLGGQKITAWDLQRFKIPAGGQTEWEINDGTGDIQRVKYIRGIIVFHQVMRSFWREEFSKSGGGTPPDCWAPDSQHGIGDPGTLCAQCEYAEFGSDPKGGVGQACKQMDMLFVLREKNILPSIIAVTPGSLKDWKNFLMALLNNSKPLISLVIDFYLEQTKSKKNITYAKVHPRVVKELSDEEKGKMVAYSAMVKPMIANIDLTKVAHEFAAVEEAEA